MNKSVNWVHRSTKRHRTKKLVNEIKEQVEFYFSDANINRDKYMLSLVGPNGNNYVSLNILLAFNQLKQLCTNLTLLQKAIFASELLLLNQEKTAVRRTSDTLLPLPSNIEDCTIFVDNLPTNVTISWLKDVCKKLGKINYISLPQYKSGFSKGFAFIEFNKPADATTACSILNSPPKNFFSTIPVLKAFKPKFSLEPVENFNAKTSIFSNFDSTSAKSEAIGDNQDLTTMNSFSDSISNENKKKSLLNLSLNSKLNSCDNFNKLNDIYSFKNEFKTGNSTEKKTNYGSTNKLLIKSVVTAVQHTKKRAYNYSSDYVNDDSLSSKRFKEMITSPYITSNLTNYMLSDAVNVKPTNCLKKKRRKRPRKNRHKSNANKVTNSQFCLHAMMKNEWKECRKLYLHQQRENFGKLKSILQKCSSPDPDTTSVYIKHHLALKKSAAENYLDLSDNENDSEEKNELNNKNSLLVNKRHDTPIFVPGVVVSISSLNEKPPGSETFLPLPNFTVIKEHFLQYGKVAYVDVKPDSSHGFIRFETSEAAQRAILEDKQYAICLLTGVKEEKYWDSLLVSRQLKRTRERKRTSGKTKLIMRAERRTDLSSTRHIKFNENFH